MSQENVEIVRRVYEATARRDADALLALYDPEVEWDATHLTGSLMGGGVHHGHEGILTFFHEFLGAWEGLEHLYDELIDAGEHVISVGSVQGKGRSSGVEVELTGYGVWTIRDGRVIRVAFHADRADALEAAGLSE